MLPYSSISLPYLSWPTILASGTVDIGAYEYGWRKENPSIVVTTLEDRDDPYDGLISLREAIKYANPGDTITFAPNLYKYGELTGIFLVPAQDATITLELGELIIDKSITIDASNLLREVMPDPLEDRRGAVITQVPGITIDAKGQSRVFNIAARTTVELVGLEVTGGNVNGSGVNGYGGGIFVNNNSTLAVTYCAISDNVASSSGGGIYVNNNSILTITYCEISKNVAPFSGGGIYNAGTLIVTTSAISENSLSDASTGGGIYSTSSLTVTNSTISGNTATDSNGGGIYHEGVRRTLTVNNSTISGNTARYGGGIYSRLTLLTLVNSTISDNIASYQGGGIYSSTAGTLIMNSTISGNTAEGDAYYGGGGGIQHTSSSPLTVKRTSQQP